MAEWPASSATDTLPQSDVGGRDLFFFPSLFLFPLQMHGGLIKRCGPARLMGLIAYYAGPYIMSNRLLLSLPVNEASCTSMGGKGSSDCLEKDKTMCHSCPILREIYIYIFKHGIKFSGLNPTHRTPLRSAVFTENHVQVHVQP